MEMRKLFQLSVSACHLWDVTQNFALSVVKQEAIADECYA